MSITITGSCHDCSVPLLETGLAGFGCGGIVGLGGKTPGEGCGITGAGGGAGSSTKVRKSEFTWSCHVVLSRGVVTWCHGAIPVMFWYTRTKSSIKGFFQVWESFFGSKCALSGPKKFPGRIINTR